MAKRTLKLNQRGYTLIEMAIATLLLAVMATTVVVANRFVNQQSVQNADRTFATEKAIQMYEELRALVNGNEQGLKYLGNYNNDGVDFVLTTDANIDFHPLGVAAPGNPADPLSGNLLQNGNWRYMRTVTVDPVANDSQARLVSVKVYLSPGNSVTQLVQQSSQVSQALLLSSVGGILRTSQLPYFPTQVMDMYVLQINNIPSWWSVLPTLAQYMQNDITDLQSRIPECQLRVHYITRTSYGRDPFYTPETNSSSFPSDTTHQPWIYYYPGYTPTTDGTNYGMYFDYDPTDVNSVMTTGNFMVDGTYEPVSVTQFQSAVNVSYSTADEYNNAMRYPDEMMAYKAVTSACAASTAVSFTGGVTEISERMLLENMLSEPASFQNAIIVNLHGELLPLPALRNYSDAAKDPGNQLANAVTVNNVAATVALAASNGVSGDTNVRVVTHPELLYYPPPSAGATFVPVRLRVYAYYDSEDMGGANFINSLGDVRVPAISVFLPDSCATITGVTAIIGSQSITYGYSPVTAALTTPPTNYASGPIRYDAAGNPMSMSVSYVGPGNKQTLITLYNTPLHCPVYTGGGNHGGLNSADILYGSEYIPCSPDYITANAPTSAAYANNTYSFTGQDLTLTTTAAGTPKNTARWEISYNIPVTQYVVGPANLSIWSGTYSAASASASFALSTGTHGIETRLGNGVTSNVFTNTTGGAVTVVPNLSRTYIWCGATMPPYTEQYQFTGDPRDCPYLDVKVGGPSVAGSAVNIGPNSYNWWFKNGNGSAGDMNKDGYSGFGQSNGASPWAGRCPVDLPRYYQIIRQGLLGTTSIWTGTNGWSWYYYGMGGEYGSDQQPRGSGTQSSNGVKEKSDLFMTSYSASAGVTGYNDILGDSSWGGGMWVSSNVTGSHSVTWYQRPWLGELYPDKSYMDSWVSYGNLPSVANSHLGSMPEAFYLQSMSTVPTSGNGSDDGFSGANYLPNPQGTGSNSFYDGNNATTGKTFEHQDGSNNGNLLSLGVTTYNIIGYPIPAEALVSRPWDLSGGNPPEWSIAPYNAVSMRTKIDIPTVTNATNSTVTSRLFYDDGGAANQYGSGVIRMTRTNGSVTQVGYVVETGTAPLGNIGADTLAETALVFGMRTFYDGGMMAATNVAGHIPQLPLVKIYLVSPVPIYNTTSSIAMTIGSPVTATTAFQGAVSVGWPVTNIWWRFNGFGLANYYTEEYPNYTQPMTTSTGIYAESVTVAYNLKYSHEGASKWFYVQDPENVANYAVTGVYSPTYSLNAVTNSAPWTYSFPVANGSVTLPQGAYELMVEAYRLGYGLHYAYDIVPFQVSW